MEFSTKVEVKPSDWRIAPCERMLFVGSCFADNIGQRFVADKFRATVNPYGVMYNPASILHTVERLLNDQAMPFVADEEGTALFTLGTNHVYILKSTGEIVDNCNKQPQRLFREEALSIEQCAGYLRQAIQTIHLHYPKVRFLLTVSPIRYRKYGYHGSQLSKATLLLAVDKVIDDWADDPSLMVAYFPSYEIINDELRDYRFYQPDMLHPSAQAVDYIYEKFSAAYFSADTFRFLEAWKPIREALGHRPLHPESEAYKQFRTETETKLQALRRRYPMME
ncbi:MAG: GSCFA domain-containing protein [Prevotella sp.]|nr:GSCFA domain-containing protein [Prevotella sp.]